ncbi:hypothetical protein B0I32_101286 [Nonomuraea fuscirosea]|uniref:Uncharacterized protein n=1 Tax=Nonomuraea fuscirosea TaxID=1291556 RepID=A0A2T0NB26_9ACTN|nr:hypothetical protein [Nonomuraea fuscirosea]PRX70199.1 hypothetical protein B0I32_101286 [Nonomuraea fuscirosea]
MHVNSNDSRRGRIATLAAAGAVAGLMLLPVGQGVAGASTAAVPSAVGWVSGEKPVLCGYSHWCGRRGWGPRWCGGRCHRHHHHHGYRHHHDFESHNRHHHVDRREPVRREPVREEPVRMEPERPVKEDRVRPIKPVKPENPYKDDRDDWGDWLPFGADDEG